jgi:hypothetical protein
MWRLGDKEDSNGSRTNLGQNSALIPTRDNEAVFVLMAASYQELSIRDDGNFALNLGCLPVLCVRNCDTVVGKREK